MIHSGITTAFDFSHGRRRMVGAQSYAVIGQPALAAKAAARADRAERAGQAAVDEAPIFR